MDVILWYCDEALINCDNYGGAITFDLAILGENKERKKTKSSEFIMKSSIIMSLSTNKSSEWKESSESRNSKIVVYSRWNLEFKVDQDQYL